MTKLWGGRFTQTLDPSAVDFSYSLSFDYELLPYDIQLNRAYVDALTTAGIFTTAERDIVQASLDRIRDRIPQIIANLPDDEDVHSLVERLVIDDVGDLGKKMHSGKSRNDQVATDLRLYVKDAIEGINTHIHACFKALYDLASDHVDTVFPGFTHLQVAQPVVLAHHVLAYFEKFMRDQHRFADAYERADQCPLGSAALAGSNYPLDRYQLAESLGFSDITRNSMDAVSDRDFVLDALYAASMITLHISQFCEELILWSSSIVGFITIGDAFTTGSSIMPQKKNPDIAELLRGQAGAMLGQFVAVHELIKGLPLTYNRDLQDDKKYLFTALKTTQASLNCFAKMIPTIRVNTDRIHAALNSGHILATEIADYLAMKGLPFRSAHEVVGQMVQEAEAQGCQVHELPLSTLQTLSSHIKPDIHDWLSIEAAISKKNGVGGTAKTSIRTQLHHIKEAFKW
jgi:argininosuccinate lyase